jgi:hypothetical protein
VAWHVGSRWHKADLQLVAIFMQMPNELWHYSLYYGKGKGKGKAIPLQAWTGPEGSRRLRLPDFKTIGT